MLTITAENKAFYYLWAMIVMVFVVCLYRIGSVVENQQKLARAIDNTNLSLDSTALVVESMQRRQREASGARSERKTKAAKNASARS